jgi:hypothetical protein
MLEKQAILQANFLYDDCTASLVRQQSTEGSIVDCSSHATLLSEHFPSITTTETIRPSFYVAMECLD